MEPRSIEPTDIRIDDTVRAEANATTVEGRVTSFDGFKIVIGGIVRLERGVWYWTLLSRPAPPREIGSRWRDPETGVVYIRTDETDPGRVHYVSYANRSLIASENILIPVYETIDAEIIARLVPLDGAS
jgi:hypothetical protein